jgi:2-keto-3-deoxy-L-rhamnonate aldolase RhmA
VRLVLTRAVALAAGIAALTASTLTSPAGAAGRQRLNPVIDLLEQGKAVFGVYAPNPYPPGRRGAPPPTTPPKQPMELAREALAYERGDFLFNGSMEDSVDRALPAFAEFVKATSEADHLTKTPFLRLPHPLIVKTSKISADPASKVIDNISRQLNLGTSGIMFVEAESADEVRAGLAAMRFKAHGGTRPEAVGSAPAYWGMSDAEYKRRADLWPLNPDGELINWTIVESREGLAHVREIAAVKGIGVLWPGAGTLRQVFSSTNAAGERVLDQTGWENAIQQVLAACKEFKVPCGYPANASDIETRMKQGFSVFVMGWGEAGFSAVDIGRKFAGR